jgi:hypothetical protein
MYREFVIPWNAYNEVNDHFLRHRDHPQTECEPEKSHHRFTPNKPLILGPELPKCHSTESHAAGYQRTHEIYRSKRRRLQEGCPEPSTPSRAQNSAKPVEMTSMEMTWDSNMKPKPPRKLKFRTEAERARINLLRRIGACETHRRSKKSLCIELLSNRKQLI